MRTSLYAFDTEFCSFIIFNTNKTSLLINTTGLLAGSAETRRQYGHGCPWFRAEAMFFCLSKKLAVQQNTRMYFVGQDKEVNYFNTDTDVRETNQ